MKNTAEKLNPQAFFQRSRDHLLQESTVKNILYIDEAFLAGRALRPEKRSPAEAETLAASDAPVDELAAPKFKRRPVSRTLLKSGLFLAAILLLPGALIGAPLLWWLGHRRKTPPQPTWKGCS